jgi:chorismate--pyruvate lyase
MLALHCLQVSYMLRKSGPGAGEPTWRPAEQFHSHELPARQRAWLLDDGSLTARLIASSHEPFAVQRLRQSWDRPRLSEQRALMMARAERALVREVVLTIGARPVVFARSLFPASSLTGPLRHLRHLRNRPLGAILFRHPDMQRSPFELAHLAGDDVYLPPDLRQRESAWGRRSCFEIGDRRLLVSEIFLAAFRPWRALLPVHRSQRGRVNAAILRPKH